MGNTTFPSAFKGEIEPSARVPHLHLESNARGGIDAVVHDESMSNMRDNVDSSIHME
jgi:hypothetical protein